MTTDLPQDYEQHGRATVFGIDGVDALVLKLIPPIAPAGGAEPFCDVGIGDEGLVLDQAAALRLACVLLKWGLDRGT